MLKLALERIILPKTFITLILSLFERRSNTILTAHGKTEYFRTHIGINQGEVISPLLWIIYIDPLLTELNNCNTSPYIIKSDLNIDEVQISTLAYMDNTNLVATSHEGLNNMLQVSQEFFGYNNTKINFNKAVLICNRDPHDPLLPLNNKSETAAVSFLANTPHEFSIKPIKPNETFRFLGVWFNINTTRQQILKLCKADYSLFCKSIYNKKLTIKQLTNLHNAVLLPKVEFKLKTYMPSALDCYRISSSFRKTFRKIIGFSCAIPNHFLQFPHSFNLIDLHQRCVTNNINSFYRNFIEDPLDSFPIDIRKAISHRLFEIQKYFNLPYSPLFLDNFDSFKNCKRFKDDYIPQIIYHASLINIRFAKPQYINPQDFIHTPIHYLFTDNPSLYAKSLPLLRKYNITFLSDCINDEQTSLLPYR